MSVWSTYEARFTDGVPSMGSTRDVAKDNARNRMRRRVVSSLSYQHMECDGREIEVSVRDTADDMGTKKIFSMPGEMLPHGSILLWEDSHWLITEVNAGHELCSKGKMRRCNYYLKWINDDGDVIGRWCVVEDGTKYLIGEKSADIMSIGDARMAVTLGKDEETSHIYRGKRFLIDDLDSDDVMAYEVSKPNRMFNVFNGKGVFRFIMRESELTQYDNVEKRIADYYSWHPKVPDAIPDVQTGEPFEKVARDAVQAALDKPTRIEESGVWL